MTPGSNMGAAAPVMLSPEGATPLGEKEISFVRGKMRALAESNGHNPDIAQAMVDKDIELRAYTDEAGEYIVYASSLGVLAAEDDNGELAGEDEAAVDDDVPARRGEVVLAQGKLLTVTPNEAQKFGIITAVVENFDEAAVRLVSTTYTTAQIEANWAERAFGFLTDPTIAGLLLMLALGGLYFEVKTPGFGFPGIIGLTALVLLFGAHYVLGLAEVLDLLLILTGITLIIFEVFVIPGFGLAGVAGFACLTAGLYLTLTNVTIPQYSWDYDRLAEVAWTFIMGLVAFTVFVFVTLRVFPQTPFYRMVVLGTTQDTDLGFTAQTAEMALAAVGLEGVTSSMLRPAGKGRFNGKLFDIVSRGDFLDKGVPVRIVRAEGNRYVVEAVEPEVQA
jgi:membrane-bound serine protease (ClpP class)